MLSSDEDKTLCSTLIVSPDCVPAVLSSIGSRSRGDESPQQPPLPTTEFSEDKATNEGSQRDVLSSSSSSSGTNKSIPVGIPKEDISPPAQQITAATESETAEEVADRIQRTRAASQAASQTAADPASDANSHDEWRQSWQRRNKHLFIFSDASRPIFTRYGDETEFLDFFGMMNLILSVSSKTLSHTASLDPATKASKNPPVTQVRYAKGGRKTYVYLTHGSLVYLAVSSTGESVEQIQNQLEFLHMLLLSVLTNGVHDIFERRSNYDLRPLLGGTESMMTGAIRMMNNNPAFGLSSVPVLKLKKQCRDLICKTIRARLRECGADLSTTPYAMVMYHIPEARASSSYGGAGSSNTCLLVGYLSHAKSPIHPRDFCILANCVQCSLPPSAKYQEMWTPCCLPQFSPDGFLYLYMTFVSPTISLVLVSTSKDAFTPFRGVKDALALDFMLDSNRERVASGVPPAEPNSGPLAEVASCRLYGIKDVEIQERLQDEVLHFIFKDSIHNQHTVTRFVPPFVTRKEQKQLLRHYLKAREGAKTCVGAKRTTTYTTEHYSILARIGRTYELYVAYKPLTSKQSISSWATILKKWVRSQHESLFAPPGSIS
eukprot:TRINITY_DN13904_c0_g1_i2.p1 TRINITY_DN13904_c0_g1~~TRINITY_DN13904_c0_g1_i2.p1  ORF type:complete len:709 (+),score=134.70 TRINITY_DN13904_c0_g1_i2:318-2129(+)